MINHLVKKRDGREVPFDPRKIADAIFKAAKSVGGDDRLLAEELASVVTLFVDRHYEGSSPSIEDIQDLVEKVLIDTGHGRTAKSFILYREKRRAVRDQLTVRRENKARAGNLDLASTSRSTSWNKRLIAKELEETAGLSARVADDIASSVETRVMNCEFSRISTSLIREFVRHELSERNIDLPVLISGGLLPGGIGIEATTLDPLLKNAGPLPEDIERHFGAETLRRYAEARMVPGPFIESHFDGRIHLKSLERIGRAISGSVTFEQLRSFVTDSAPRTNPTNELEFAGRMGTTLRRLMTLVDQTLVAEQRAVRRISPRRPSQRQPAQRWGETGSKGVYPNPPASSGRLPFDELPGNRGSG